MKVASLSELQDIREILKAVFAHFLGGFFQ